MNRLKFLLPIAFLLLGLNFTACSSDNEPVDPELLVPVTPTESCGTPVVFEAGPVIGGSSVNLSWTAADGTSTWQIQYGPQGFTAGSGTQVTATDDQVTITGLSSAVQYEFYIRTVCGAESFSGWAGPITPGTSVGGCATPVNATAVRSAGNTEITASWAAASVASWDVQYGAAGFLLGSGTTANSTTPTYTLTGAAATAYDFYVRANCSATSHSNWIGPIHVAAAGTSPSGGDYWPTAVGNQWVYNMNGTIQDPFAIVSADVVGGLNYFTFTTPVQANTGVTRIRKANGNYYIKTEQVTLTTPLPGTISGNEVIILKDNIAAGATWTDNYSQTTNYTGLPPIVTNVSVVNTIEAKDVTVSVNGLTYNNVIKVNRVMTAGTTVYNGYYWFARDIGPVKIMNGNGAYVQELQSYIVN